MQWKCCPRPRINTGTNKLWKWEQVVDQSQYCVSLSTLTNKTDTLCTWVNTVLCWALSCPWHKVSFIDLSCYWLKNIGQHCGNTIDTTLYTLRVKCDENKTCMMLSVNLQTPRPIAARSRTWKLRELLQLAIQPCKTWSSHVKELSWPWRAQVCLHCTVHFLKG